LDSVGEPADVLLLREIARGPGIAGSDKRLGKSLARRLAPRILVEDLGRIRIRVGTTTVDSQDIRRKVLALLTFLVTRPRFAATREEVMEAMWPDIDPSAAQNSLNQTVYFLRRVFEPEYSEETSAGYVLQDSDLLWLDDELVDTVSRRCASQVARYERDPSPDAAEALSEIYVGRFALDFAYEEWSRDFREWLHVAYLHIVETQVRSYMKSGLFDAGITMARRALEIDPRHEDLEVSLVRLLRNSGAHSAAAEQYARYASYLRRDLGIDAPPLDSL
jgi:DNA-binding SARP family transcriptional activator